MTRQTVTQNLGGSGGEGSKGTAVDTTPESDEEKDLQNKAIDEMDSGDDEGQDTDTRSDDTSDKDVQPQDGEKQPKEETKSDDKKGDDFKVSETDQQWGTADPSEDEKTDGDKDNNKINKQLTESQAEGVRLHKMLVEHGIDPKTGQKVQEPPQSETPPASPPEQDQNKQTKHIVDFLEDNKAVVGEAAVQDYQKYLESGNNVFIYNNPSLKALSSAVDSTSEKLPLTERLQIGFKIAFGDRLADKKAKQAKVEAEIKNQEINKMVDTGESTPSETKKSGYTAEQLEIAKSMGVELE